MKIPPALLLTVIGCSLFAGKLFRLHFDFKYYVSDIWVNAEAAICFFRTGRPFVSSVFGNMAAVHWYGWSLIEGPFLLLFGIKFYAVVSLAYVLCSLFSANQIGRSLGLPAYSPFTLLTACFMCFNPLAWFCLNQAPYGFQYDLYALPLLPLLIAQIWCGSRLSLAITLVLTLAIKEEIALALICSSLALGIFRRIRGRACFVGVCSLLYVSLANYFLTKFRDLTPNPATILAKDAMLKALRPFIHAAFTRYELSNPILNYFSEYHMATKWVGTFQSVIAFPAALPLSLYNSLTMHTGLWAARSPESSWKYPYICGVSAGVSALYLLKLFSSLENEQGRKVLSSIVILTMAVTIPSAMSWLEVNPEYQLSVPYNYALYGHLPFHLHLPDAVEMRTRARDIEKIKEIAGESSVVLTPGSQGFLMGQPTLNAHYKPIVAGRFLWVKELRTPLFGADTKDFYREWDALPEVFHSDNFIAKWSVFEVNDDRKWLEISYRRTGFVWPAAGTPAKLACGEQEIKTYLVWPSLISGSIQKAMFLQPKNWRKDCQLISREAETVIVDFYREK